MEKIEPLLGSLQQLDYPHAAYGILKIYIGTPKMLYSLRTVKKKAPQLLKYFFHFDTAQRDCLETLIKGNFECSNWKQANLPIKLGGLSLRSSSDRHLAAFIISMEFVLSTVEALVGMKPTLEHEVNAN